MPFTKRLAIGLIGIFVAVGIASIAVASTDPVLSGIQGSSGGEVGVQDSARIASVKYVVNFGPVTSLERSDPVINIDHGNNLFLTIKGRCTGPSSQRGNLLVADVPSGTVRNAVLLTPGKTKTMTTNPPLRFADGLYQIGIVVVAPDGTADSFIITINVA